MTIKKITPKKALFLSIILGAGLFIASFILAQTSCPSNTTVEGETRATLVGEVTDDGGDPTLEVWFQYGRSTSYGLRTPAVSQYGTGVFCSTVDNLTPCSKYYYRAVAKNSAQTSYGARQEFTTKCPISVDIKANSSNGPITVSYQSNITLAWTAKDAVVCQASGDWLGEKDPSGTEIIHMDEVRTHTFTITCEDSTSTATDSVVVNVRANPPTVITVPAVITY